MNTQRSLLLFDLKFSKQFLFDVLIYCSVNVFLMHPFYLNHVQICETKTNVLATLLKLFP